MPFPPVRNAIGLLALSVIALVLVAGACDKVLGPKSKSFIVSPDTATLTIGGRTYVRATMALLAPATVLYASSDTTVAVVDSSGLVQGVGAGTAAIRAWPVADSALVDSLRVQVLPRSGTWVVLYPDSAQILQGAARQLRWRTDSTSAGVVLRSSDSTAASVDSTGLVCGKRGGSLAIIRATSAADSTAADSARIFVATPLPSQHPPGC